MSYKKNCEFCGSKLKTLFTTQYCEPCDEATKKEGPKDPLYSYTSSTYKEYEDLVHFLNGTIWEADEQED